MQNKAARTHNYHKTKTDILYSKVQNWNIPDLLTLSVAKFM